MIKNDREYRITQSRVSRFKQALEYLAEARKKKSLDAATIDLQESATKSILQSLETELRDYVELKEGASKSQFRELLNQTGALSLGLIRARIALNWTQKELAARVGTSEQQIQRYEASDYESASLGTIKKISSVMSEQLGNNS
jgi:predicted transcriptional regulator